MCVLFLFGEIRNLHKTSLKRRKEAMKIADLLSCWRRYFNTNLNLFHLLPLHCTYYFNRTKLIVNSQGHFSIHNIMFGSWWDVGWSAGLWKARIHSEISKLIAGEQLYFFVHERTTLNKQLTIACITTRFLHDKNALLNYWSLFSIIIWLVY